MKLTGLIFTLFLGIVLEGYSQDNVLDLDKLVFESETEENIWKAKPNDPYPYFTALDAKSLSEDTKWVNLLKEIDEKAAKNPDQLSLLRTIFQKSHQRLFKKYEQHSSFNKMLTEGRYDCVSGSAVLGMLLERFGFTYDIIETDYHVFIQVSIEGKPVILESTLPVGGMISTPSEIEKYLSSYLPKKEATPVNFNQRLAGPSLVLADNSIFRKVKLVELAGLQYYNDAIVHFNNQEFGQAVHQLSKAYLLYPADRIEGLRELSIDLAFKTYGYDLRN
ncbi:hypothetical protein ACFPIK_07900 [Algoriphagus aquatilis]|uniref:Protein SirB1 N-terminal domain-containing protein n=1 Tax=Algoriphagus aquatilis TaxID=490186 RepID=A0ABW0BUX2_9BACT